MMDVQKQPDQEHRIETGPLKFGDDWCGVFIRGDNAFGHALDIELVLSEINNGQSVSPIGVINLERLMNILRSCDERTQVRP